MERTGMIGDILSRLLSVPQITDLCINGREGIFLDRGEGMTILPDTPDPPLSEENLRSWVLDQLSLVGKTWDAKHPFVDATLPTGHRLHAVFPPLAQQGILVSLRRLGRPMMEGQKGNRWNATPYYPLLSEAFRRGNSILISGATGSGKTTLASDLLGEVSSHERIIALEDTQELAPNHSHFLSLVSRPPNPDGFGEVSLRTLLKQTLRMRPDRIVLGECRGAEVLELLQALNTGHHGGMATLHANSPREALRRIELLCLLASSGSVPIHCIRELLTLGIQWIVQVKREKGIRKIAELWKIEGREGDTILMRQVLDYEVSNWNFGLPNE